jgi:hypothetical protein
MSGSISVTAFRLALLSSFNHLDANALSNVQLLFQSSVHEKERAIFSIAATQGELFPPHMPVHPPLTFNR